MISRRLFGTGMMAMAGDGLRRPVNAPPAGVAAYGVQPGASTPVVRASQVFIFGPAGTITGLFVYAPGTVPGPGNPPIASIGNNSVDPYGNVTEPGIASQNNAGSWVSLFGGEVEFSGGSSISGAAATGALVFDSPTAFDFDGAPIVSTAGTPGAPTIISTDAWNSLGGVAGTNCTVIQDRYTMTPEQECEIDIALEALAGGSTAGTYTFANALPAAYRFAGNFLRIYPLPFNAPITTATQDSIIAVDGSGTGSPGRVRITIPAVAANVYFTGTCRVPLTL
jgi:hypothetical protein